MIVMVIVTRKRKKFSGILMIDNNKQEATSLFQSEFNILLSTAFSHKGHQSLYRKRTIVKTKTRLRHYNSARLT